MQDPEGGEASSWGRGRSHLCSHPAGHGSVEEEELNLLQRVFHSTWPNQNYFLLAGFYKLIRIIAHLFSILLSDNIIRSQVQSFSGKVQGEICQ